MFAAILAPPASHRSVALRRPDQCPLGLEPFGSLPLAEVPVACDRRQIKMRMQIERSSISLEHDPKSIEFCSSQVVSVDHPKPSGLGMVSIFKTSAARTLLAGLSQNDACRFRPHGLQHGQTRCRTGPVGFSIDTSIRTARAQKQLQCKFEQR